MRERGGEDERKDREEEKRGGLSKDKRSRREGRTGEGERKGRRGRRGGRRTDGHAIRGDSEVENA